MVDGGERHLLLEFDGNFEPLHRPSQKETAISNPETAAVALLQG